MDLRLIAEPCLQVSGGPEQLESKRQVMYSEIDVEPSLTQTSDRDLEASTPLLAERFNESPYERVYRKYCKGEDIRPDGGVVIALRKNMSVIQLSDPGDMGNLALLPLCKTLSTYRTSGANLTLDFTGALIKDTGMPVLCDLLLANPSITVLRIRSCGFTGVGVQYLASRLSQTSITDLDISSNRMGDAGAAALCDALETQDTNLVRLDIARNLLGSKWLNRVVKSLKTGGKKLAINFQGNFMQSELWNAVTHGLGIPLAVAGLVMLLHLYKYQIEQKVSKWDFTEEMSIWMYGISLILMYTTSTLYHSMFYLHRTVKYLQTWDHTAIYCLIAGTYTPVFLIGCKDDPIGRWIGFGAYWLLACIGITAYCNCGDTEHTRAYPAAGVSCSMKLELALYALMGILGAFYPLCSCSAGWGDNKWELIAWLVSGGIAYLGGIYFFSSGSTRPNRHVMWHLAVMLGSALHYTGVYRFVWSLPRWPTKPVNSPVG